MGFNMKINAQIYNEQNISFNNGFSYAKREQGAEGACEWHLNRLRTTIYMNVFERSVLTDYDLVRYKKLIYLENDSFHFHFVWFFAR